MSVSNIPKKKVDKKNKKVLTNQKEFGILKTQLEKKQKCSLKTKQNVNFELSGLNYNN